MAMNFTRYIALPKDWLRNQGIDRGDELDLSMSEDGDLILRNPNKGGAND